MARPIKQTEKQNDKVEVKDTVVEAIDVQKMIAEAVAKALAEKEKEIEQIKKENKAEVKPASTYKLIPSTTRVRLKSNINGKFIWNEDRGKTRVFIEVDDAGHEFVLDYDELQIVSKKNFLKKAMLAIVEVYSDNDDILVYDVAKDLNVGNLYDGEFVVNDLEKLFNENTSVEQFKAFIKDNPETADTILDVAYRLFKKGSFTNSFKMDVLRQGFGNRELFK